LEPKQSQAKLRYHFKSTTPYRDIGLNRKVRSLSRHSSKGEGGRDAETTIFNRDEGDRKFKV